jgi:hypothetical protein
LRIIGTIVRECEKCGRAKVGDVSWGEWCPFCTSEWHLDLSYHCDDMKETMERVAREA